MEGDQSVEHLLACQVSSWYPQFRDVSFPTQIIPLPKEFVDYLVADGVFAGEHNRAVSALAWECSVLLCSGVFSSRMKQRLLFAVG